MSSLSFDHPCSFGQAQRSFPVLFQLLSNGIAALYRLPSLFCETLCLPLRWFPIYSVSLKALPQIILQKFLLFQDCICFHALELSCNSSSVPASTLVWHFSSSVCCNNVPFFCLPSLQLFCHEGSLFDMQPHFMKIFCNVFPLRPLFFLSVLCPLFLRTVTVSARSLVN